MADNDKPEVESLMEANQAQPEVIFPVRNLEWDDRSQVHLYVALKGGGSPVDSYTGPWICELYHDGVLRHSTADIQADVPFSYYEISGLYAYTLVIDDVFGEELNGRLDEYASAVSTEAGIYY